MANFGKRNLLSITRETNSGLYLDGEELGEILLPGRYVPQDLEPDAKLDVFLYRDSEDRLVATTEKPYAMVGEFAYLTVKHVHERMGAFLDWGLSNEPKLGARKALLRYFRPLFQCCGRALCKAL